MTPDVPKPLGAYSLWKDVGEIRYFSGVGARDVQTNQIVGNEFDEQQYLVRYDIEMQCHQAFQNLRSVLEESGLALDSVVRVRAFLRNIDVNFDRYNEIFEKYFGGLKPARTTIGVAGLPGTGAAIELEVEAKITK